MIRIGKAISRTLLSRTFTWKREVYELCKAHTARMLSASNHSRVTACLICGNGMSPYLEVDFVAYGHCDSCNHVQSLVRPTPNFISTLYSSEINELYSTQDMAYIDLPESALNARVNEIALPKVEWIKDLICFEPEDLWIDIGSGTGDILIAAKLFGFNVLGIETSLTELSLAEKRSIPTLKLFYDGSQKIAQLETAKVVSLFNVLEHTLDPMDFLSSITRQMRLGSYLIIEVPRLDSLSSIIQATNPKYVYRHIYPPEHLNIFSDKSLEYALTTLSMKKKAIWYFGSDAIEIFGHVCNLVQPSFEGGMDIYFQEINALQEQLDKRGLSDVMLLVVEKK